MPLVLLLFSALFIGESVFSYTQKSATWDEPIHLTDGYYALAAHDYRYDPAHPPLLRMWAALPLLIEPGLTADASVIDRTRPDIWALGTVFDDAHYFMYVEHDADRLLYRARFMVVLLGVVLGIVVFLWTHAWLGFLPAAAALAMIALEPNLVAHFSLVTTDAGLTCLVCAAVYFLWRTLEYGGALNVLALSVSVALAVTAKFSAVLLFPVVFALLGLAVFPLRRISLSRAFAISAMLLAVSWLAIWAVYGFRYAPSASADWLYQFQNHPDVVRRVPSVARVIAWIDAHHLLPNVFSQGFLLVQAQAQVRTAFLAGQYSATGWWYFFPFAMAIKTPLPLLLFAAAGLFMAVRAWRDRSQQMMACFLVVPIAGFMLPAMLTHLNIGLRHVLPIYPFVVMLAALGLKSILDRPQTAGRVAIAIAAVFWMVEYGRAYPDTLAFFNTAVGGPDRGAEYLVDSNLDWGQDLKGLKQWMDANRVSQINLAYFGSADPAYYGIHCTYINGSPYFASAEPPRLPGYVAVSATVRSGTNFDVNRRDFYKPLRSLAPVATIGHTIAVYWIDRPWWPRTPAED